MVGRGSYGAVYKGLWDGKVVALKRIQVSSGEDRHNLVANSQEITALRYVCSYFKQLYDCKSIICVLQNA